VKNLLAKHNTFEFNPEKGEELLTRKGWKKDAAGIWLDPQRQRLALDISGFGSTGPAIGPVLTELLKRQGVAASTSLPPDFDDRFQKGA
jgi:peptide/nickel transport system substrate-binding protein